MDTLIAASRSRSPEVSVAAGKPILRGIHHLAPVTGDMRMTLDFYVRVLGMPIVHGLRTPSRPAGASHAHGDGAPPYSNIPHYFLDMGGDSLLAFFEYPKGIAKVDRDGIGAMQHVSFACGPQRYHEVLERLKANGVTINAGPLLVIPPAIHSFYFLILMASGSKSPLTWRGTRRICKSSDLAAWTRPSCVRNLKRSAVTKPGSTRWSRR
jgi:catechol 2,3-dioxygenase-like lactoylglutathione lyase family enzyme